MPDDDYPRFVQITPEALELASNMADYTVQVCAEQAPSKIDPRCLVVCLVAQLLRVAQDKLEFPPEVVLSMVNITLKDLGYEYDDDWKPPVIDLSERQKTGEKPS